MKVRDLIEHLQRFDPHDKVSLLVICDYSGECEKHTEFVGSVERDNSSGSVVIKPE